MITRIMVALLALYVVSGGGQNGTGYAPAANMAATSELLPAQASLAKQALDFCLAHRAVCTEAAANLMKTTGSLPESPVNAAPPALALTPPTMRQAEWAGEIAPSHRPAPDLPVPPRRRHGSNGA